MSDKKEKKGNNYLQLMIFAVFGALFVLLMHFIYNRSSVFRELFGNGTEVMGELPNTSPDTIASRNRFAGRLSMYIFSVITALQFVAFALGATVVRSIKKSDETASVKLKHLENAEIFFDVPLYVGLFGTISAFLVMTYSPQSSRLIAYSSTLIGIIFSLILRLTLQYPFKRRLIEGAGKQEKNRE